MLEEKKVYLVKKYQSAYEYEATFRNENIPEIKNTNKLRENFAVVKMLTAMKQNNQKVGIVVFGMGHTEGLIKEFLEQTKNNINIIVLKP